MYYIGIDPGIDGAIVVINNDKCYLHNIPKIKNKLDVHKLNIIFNEYLEKNSYVFIEDVHAIFGSSAKSTFNFGWICGIKEAMIVSKNIPFIKVRPKIWQKEIFQGISEIRKPSKKDKNGKIIKGKLDTKAMALMAYKRLFPGLDLYITERGNKSKNAHPGLVDALLIAEYGRRKYERK